MMIIIIIIIIMRDAPSDIGEDQGKEVFLSPLQEIK